MVAITCFKIKFVFHSEIEGNYCAIGSFSSTFEKRVLEYLNPYINKIPFLRLEFEKANEQN